MMDARIDELRRILSEIGPSLVAFSGGVDSTFLLAAAHQVLGDGVLAVTAVSPSLPQEEKDEAVRLARLIGAPHRLITTREMERPGYVRNDGERCYFCKQELFEVMQAVLAGRDGRPLLYGAILDDLGDDRPGMRAAREAGVRAPLIEARLDKAAIRSLSLTLGLPTWDKPAMACLASRIPRFTPVTFAALSLVERAEAAVRRLGYRQVRVRHYGDRASIELDREGLRRAARATDRVCLVEAVVQAGFREANIDPAGYAPGGTKRPGRGAH